MYSIDVPVALYSACRTWRPYTQSRSNRKRGTYLDGTVKNSLKLYFVEQLVWEHVRIRVVLLPRFLPPVSHEIKIIR
jgi:hypothetical protein